MDKQISKTKATKVEIVLSQDELIDAIATYLRVCTFSKYQIPHEATVKLALAKYHKEYLPGPDYVDFEEGDNLSLYWEHEVILEAE